MAEEAKPDDLLAMATRMIAEMTEDMSYWCLLGCNPTWEDKIRALRVMGHKFRKWKKKSEGLDGIPYRRIRDMDEKARHEPLKLHDLMPTTEEK